MNSELDLDGFVCSVIASACNVELTEVTSSTNLLDIGMDSLNLVSIIAQIQIYSGVEFTSDQVVALFDASLVADLVILLRQMINQAGLAPEVSTQ
jgi:acyl carrier protein